MKKKMDIIRKMTGKPMVKTILSTIGNRRNVGNAKEGVDLVSIVQKLSKNREKASEEGSLNESVK